MTRRPFARPAMLALPLLALLATSCGRISSVVDKIREKISGPAKEVPAIKAPAAGENGYLFGGMLHAVGAAEYPGLVNDPDRLVFVYFSAGWCPPCKVLEPQMGSLAAEYPMTTLFVKIDVDQNVELAKQLGVKSIPDVRYFRSGKMLGSFVGLRPIEEVRELVKQNAPSSLPPRPKPAPPPESAKTTENPPPAKGPGKPGVTMVVIPSTPAPAQVPEPSLLDKLREKAGLVKKPDPALQPKAAPPPIRPAKADEEWMPAGMGRGEAPPPPPADGQPKK